MVRGLGGDFSLLKEGAIVLSIIANFLMMLGFISTAWGVPNTREYDPDFEGLGLWKFCYHESRTSSICIRNSPGTIPSWFEATQAFMVLSIIPMLASLICMIVSECCTACRTDPVPVLVFCFLAGSAFLFGMIGVIIFGSEIHEHRISLPTEPDMYFSISWAYILCCVAVGLYIFITLFGVAELLFSKKLEPLPPAPWNPRAPQEDIDLSPYVDQMRDMDGAGAGAGEGAGATAVEVEAEVMDAAFPY